MRLCQTCGSHRSNAADVTQLVRQNYFQEAKMAPRIKAVNAYRPRIEQGNTVQKPELIRAVSRATSLVEGTVDLVIKEVRDQAIEFCRSGRAVKVEGLGTF